LFCQVVWYVATHPEVLLSGGASAAQMDFAVERQIRKNANAPTPALKVSQAGGAATAGAKVTTSQPQKTGSIYRVPGKGTKSAKPYIGRHNKPNPQKTRKGKDGRDRTQAEVIDTYDPKNPVEGRVKEQEAIDNHGGVENLDNKRNEVAPEKMPELKKKIE
jgi:hypothetical protein